MTGFGVAILKKGIVYVKNNDQSIYSVSTLFHGSAP
jgi:hypothetical protein